MTRTIKVINAPEWIIFAGATQLAQVRRTRTKAGKKTVEVVHVITSAIALLRLTGWTNIAAGTRHHFRNPARAITCLLTS